MKMIASEMRSVKSRRGCWPGKPIAGRFGLVPEAIRLKMLNQALTHRKDFVLWAKDI